MDATADHGQCIMALFLRGDDRTRTRDLGPASSETLVHHYYTPVTHTYKCSHTLSHLGVKYLE